MSTSGVCYYKQTLSFSPEAQSNHGSTSHHSVTAGREVLTTEGHLEVLLPHLKLPEELFSFQELKLCKLYKTRLLQNPSVHYL